MPVPQPPQYQCTMHRGWSWLREQWDLHGGSIAGHVGFQAVSALSARLSHPPVPIFMYLLAALGTLSNGASINVWGSPMPIAIWVLNVNYSQTRKSQLTALMESLCSKADAMAEELWGAVLKTKQAYAASSARAAASEETDCEQDGDTLQSAASRGKHRARRGSDADNSLEEPLQIHSSAASSAVPGTSIRCVPCETQRPTSCLLSKRIRLDLTGMCTPKSCEFWRRGAFQAAYGSLKPLCSTRHMISFKP